MSTHPIHQSSQREMNAVYNQLANAENKSAVFGYGLSLSNGQVKVVKITFLQKIKSFFSPSARRELDELRSNLNQFLHLGDSTKKISYRTAIQHAIPLSTPTPTEGTRDKFINNTIKGSLTNELLNQYFDAWDRKEKALDKIDDETAATGDLRDDDAIAAAYKKAGDATSEVLGAFHAQVSNLLPEVTGEKLDKYVSEKLQTCNPNASREEKIRHILS